MGSAEGTVHLTKEQKLTELVKDHQEMMADMLLPEQGQPEIEQYHQYQRMCLEALLPFAYAYDISEQELWTALTKEHEVQFCKTETDHAPDVCSRTEA